MAQTNQLENYTFDVLSGVVLVAALKMSVGATGDVTMAGVRITGSTPGFGVAYDQYRLRKAVFQNARDVNNVSKDCSGTILSLWTGAGGSGTQLINGQTLSNLTANTAFQEVTLTASANNTVLTATTLFINIGTAVSGGFVDMFLYGDPVPANL